MLARRSAINEYFGYDESDVERSSSIQLLITRYASGGGRLSLKEAREIAQSAIEGVRRQLGASNVPAVPKPYAAAVFSVTRNLGATLIKAVATAAAASIEDMDMSFRPPTILDGSTGEDVGWLGPSKPIKAAAPDIGSLVSGLLSQSVDAVLRNQIRCRAAIADAEQQLAESRKRMVGL